MTSTEIFRALNEFIALYPNYYKNQSRESMERIARSWMKKYEDVTDYDTFINALYEFERTSDYSSPPTTKQLLDLYKTLRMRKKTEERRIETPEEVMYNLYLKEMQKPPEKRDETLIRMCLPCAKLFNDPVAYKKHFGKSREEFEKL